MTETEDHHSEKHIGLAFALTFGAGLATCLGGMVVFFPSTSSIASKELLAGSLAFSAGVMIYVSLVEILGESAQQFFENGSTSSNATLFANLSFLGGLVIIYILDWIIYKIDPEYASCRNADTEDQTRVDSQANTATDSPEYASERDDIDSFLDIEIFGDNLGYSEPPTPKSKVGMITGISIALHNFPEGLATFVATMDDPSIGVSFALAIAIHNIPEGLAIAMPVYYATGSKNLAFFYSFLSAMAEPLGGFIGYAILGVDLDHVAFGVMFGVVAGMMVGISFKELLPTASRYATYAKVEKSPIGGGYHIYQNASLVSFCCFLGMAVMASSLVLFDVGNVGHLH